MVFLAGFFTVKPGEKAVILRFGKPVGEGQNMLLSSGKFYWSFPYPIDEVVRIPITQIQRVTSTAGWYLMSPTDLLMFEAEGKEPQAGGDSLNPLFERYVISADTNVIHSRAVVTYEISDPQTAIFGFAGGTNQQFNLAGISNAVQNAADNALVATAARFNVDDILYANINGFQAAVEERIKELVKQEKLGVSIDNCQVRSLPVRQLEPDFLQVTDARQKRNEVIEKALGDGKTILSEAGAQANLITNNAESARFKYVTSMNADMAAFTNLLAQFKTNTVLYEQMRLAEAMPQILTNADKFFLPRRADGKARELRVMLNREPVQNTRPALNQ